MKLQIQSMQSNEARQIAAWQYEPPFSLYNLSDEDIPALLEPQNRYFSVYTEDVGLIGFCCFGEEAMVKNGNYDQREPALLDIGVGMHPGYVGRGLGREFVAGVLEFAEERNHPERFRVTIAAFNQPSQKTFRALGFEVTSRFRRASDRLEFVQMERDSLRPSSFC